MIGKVGQDSFQSLRIQIDCQSEPFGFNLGSPTSSLGDSLSSLDRDCPVGSGRPGQFNRSQSQTCSQSPSSSQPQPVQNANRYKTEMCRPFQENGTCKYGDKCQFAHGNLELRTVSRHPKYKTDLCRTYHSVGFCPYGPRCHFVHALDEVRSAPVQSPEKKAASGPVKQLPMFGRNSGDTNAWSFNPDSNKAEMRSAVAQLDKYFNISANRPYSSHDSSRSGSFCSDAESLPSSSPPRDSFCASPNDDPNNSRLPLFSRFAWSKQRTENICKCRHHMTACNHIKLVGTRLKVASTAFKERVEILAAAWTFHHEIVIVFTFPFQPSFLILTHFIFAFSFYLASNLPLISIFIIMSIYIYSWVSLSVDLTTETSIYLFLYMLRWYSLFYNSIKTI